MGDKAASLHVFVDDPETGLQAVCQVRGMFNVETWKTESYRGLLQPAAHGKFKPEDEDDPFRCMLRESGEELGQAFLDYLCGLSREQIPTLDIPGGVTHFSVCVSRAVVQQIRPHASSAGLRFLGPKSVAAFDRALGKEHVTSGGVNAMFADDLAAMEEARRHWTR